MQTLVTLSSLPTNQLSELASAVRLGDRRRAIQLAKQILRGQSTKAINRARIEIERNVRRLLASLEQPPPRLGVRSIPTSREFRKRGLKTGRSKLNIFIETGPRASSNKTRGFRAGRFMTKYTPESRSNTGVCIMIGDEESYSTACHSQTDICKVVRPQVSSSKTSVSRIGRFIADRTLESRIKTDGSVVIRKRASSSKKSEADGMVYPVWFGTNRKQEENGSWGTKLNDHTIKGCANVYIPKTHRFGETGNGFWKRFLRWDLRDDHLRVLNISTLQTAEFFSQIKQEMQAAREKDGTSQALFFLHGFNVTFEEAAIRAAQIGSDLKVTGATAFFSWPSFGDVSLYSADEARIEASEKAITDFLVEFSANCGADKVNVIAHSMGNRGLLRALQRIAANAELNSKVKLCQIFLAAPDVDRSLFIDLAGLYAEHAERTTLYVSNSDKAVHLSALLHAAPRAGYYTPYTVVSGVDTIAVPDFNIDLLGHSYFAQAEALLHDIHDLMHHGEPPSKRQRIEPATCDGGSFWRFRR